MDVDHIRDEADIWRKRKKEKGSKKATATREAYSTITTTDDFIQHRESCFYSS
jgi:hypothetical protein